MDDRRTETAPRTRTCLDDATTHDDDDDDNAEAADQIDAGRARELDELAPPLPPDGGWGWAVVVAAFFANLILDGVCYTFGIIMPALQQQFQAGKGKTALVGSMLPGCYLIVGKIIVYRNCLSVIRGVQRVARKWSVGFNSHLFLVGTIMVF